MRRARPRRSKMKMKSFSPLLILLLLMVGCDESGYTEVQKNDLDTVFVIHSSPTFEGYFYEGSDQDFHYFSSRWKYEGDRKVKIAKSGLEVAKEFDLGSDELGLTILNIPNPGSIFCEIEGRPVYEKVTKLDSNKTTQTTSELARKS